MELKEFFNTTLREHAELVSTGIPSHQALDVVTNRMQSDNLTDSLNQLNTGQLDKLINALKECYIPLEGKKYLFFISGIYKKKGIWTFELNDAVVEINNQSIKTEDLTNYMIEVILKGIRSIL